MSQYSLGGKQFGTWKAVSDHARAVLHRSLPGVALEGGDAAFVRDLFSFHPEAVVKAGSGIDFFYVAVIPAWGTRNFHLCRSDGTFDNFSIKKCVESMKKNVN